MISHRLIERKTAGKMPALPRAPAGRTRNAGFQPAGLRLKRN